MRSVPKASDAVDAQGKGSDWYHESVQRRAEEKLRTARASRVTKNHRAEFTLRPMNDKEKKKLVRTNTAVGALAGAGMGAALGSNSTGGMMLAGAGAGGLAGAALMRAKSKKVAKDPNIRVGEWRVSKALGGSTPSIARRVTSLGSGVRPPTAPMPAKSAQGSKSLRPLNSQGLRQPGVGQGNKAKRQSFPRL